MSHWGKLSASNVLLLLIININLLLIISYKLLSDFYNSNKFDKEITKRKEVTNFNKPLSNTIKSIICGSLLGDGHAEKRSGGKGTRIIFYQESIHSEYLLYLHYLVASLGYCNTTKPKIKTRLGKKGKTKYIIRFATWTYDIFNDIYSLWYINNIKIIPKDWVSNNLTPLALAIWIQDDGGRVSKGLKLATNSFRYEDCIYLSNLLTKKYNLITSVVSAGPPNQYNIYIKQESMKLLYNIVSPYIVKSMLYKITL